MTQQLQTPPPTFLPLTHKTFAEYTFVYRINDGYSINEISKITNKHQLLFQKLESKNQQLNLMFVDSAFASILADVALEVCIGSISSFSQYVISKNKIKVVDEKEEDRFFKFKFCNFIYLLLYSDISSKTVFNGETFTVSVYCLKNKFGELEYFSIYEQSKLQLKLLEELNLQIDFHASSVVNEETKLHLIIKY
jgi:hypothetical protein